jgi:hypothetical protein
MSEQVPELEKMRRVKGESEAIGEFIEWLGMNGMWIGQYVDLGYREPRGVPVGKSIEQMLADFYGIDLVKAEQGRRMLLAAYQKEVL